MTLPGSNSEGNSNRKLTQFPPEVNEIEKDWEQRKYSRLKGTQKP